MATTNQRREAARAALIASATELIIEGGYARASVLEIGARAGLSRGSVNYHFGTKAAMLEAVVDDAVARWQNDMRGSMSILSDQASFAAQRDAMWAAWQSDPQRSRLAAMLIFEATAPSSDLLPKIAGLHADAVSFVCQAVKDLQTTGHVPPDLTAELFARSYITVAVGLITQSAFLDTIDAEAAYDGVRELLASPD